MNLTNLPYTVYINLDTSVNRRLYMEEQAKKYNLELNRFAGICDGGIIKYLIPNLGPELLSIQEAGCLLSHLSIIKAFSETDQEAILILEDDVDFSTSELWPFTWDEFYASLPKGWGTVQLHRDQIAGWDIGLTTWKQMMFSCAAYLVSNAQAKRIVKAFWPGEQTTLPPRRSIGSFTFRPVADMCIYDFPDTYSVNILSIAKDVRSTIRTDNAGRLPEFFNKSADFIHKEWSERPRPLDQLMLITS